MSPAKKVQVFAWTASAASVALSLLAWGNGISWQLSSRQPLAYQIFPLLGLTAFSLMWSHYVTSAFRTRQNVPRGILKTYLEITSTLVLIAILLHPGLLWVQLWRDGFGLPPNSYLQHYVAPTLRWAAMLGTLSLVAFLAYELRRKFASRSWWKYVQRASDVGMIAIFIHGLKLGRNLQTSWFKYIWYFYGVSLILSMVYVYGQQKRAKGKDS